MPAPQWPPTAQWFSALLTSPESRLTEFKREWYNLEVSAGRAEMTKDVVAIANSVEPEQMGVIVIGIDDPTRGSTVTGVSSHPSAEQVSQILASYSEPVPHAEYAAFEYQNKSIGVLAVFPSPFRPHYITRDVQGVVSRTNVYVRRGPIVGIATFPEIEALFRAKGARLEGVPSQEPIQAGFVEIASPSTGEVVARVTNISAQPVADVDVLLDASIPALPQAAYREFRYVGRTLAVGESIEARFKIQPEDFVMGGAMLGLEWRGTLATRNMNLTLLVQYRDGDGLIRQSVLCAARRS